MREIVLIIIEFLFLLVPSFFDSTPQRSEMPESSLRIQKKIIIGSTVCAMLLFFFLLLTTRLGLGVTFLVSIIPIIVIIVFLCYRWKCHSDVPTLTFAMVLEALLSIGVLLGVIVYEVQINMHRNIPERLPPAVPPPVDFLLPPSPIVDTTLPQ